MQTTRFSRFPMLAALAIASASVWPTVTAACERIGVAIARTVRKVADFAFRALLVLVDVIAGERIDFKPGLTFAQVKAFTGRLMRRERPLVTSSWRMCPST